MRWIVTGGVGFIGFHLSRALLSRGEDIVIVDDFSDAPYPTAMKRRNAADLEAEFGATSRLKIFHVCITDTRALAPLVNATEGIVHLAGLAGVRPSFADPARYAKVNVEGTAHLAQLAIAAGHRRFVFASSSSVYGNATPLPAREESAAIVPESPYAASKRSAELMVRSIVQKSQMSATGLRFFTVYGARQRPEMAITLFARALLAGSPIKVFGDGSMKRDFTHVDDIVRGVVLASERTTPGFHLYNLGSGAPIDLNGLVKELSRATGREPILERGPVPQGDVDATFADITRAKNDLAWSPNVQLSDGLKSVVDWVKANPILA